MKKHLVYFISLLLIVILPIAAYAESYVGNRNTRKFHSAACTYANRINSSNKVFFNSRGEAVNAGYIPCKVCKP